MAGALTISMTPAALPEMARELGMNRAEMQWIATGYPAVAGSLQLAAAWFSDRFGVRPALLTSLVIFAVATACGALAADATTLIVARVAQGVGGSALAPVTLAFFVGQSAEERRARAVSGWAATAAVATTAGPLISGLLTDLWGWRFLHLLLIGESVFALALCCMSLPAQITTPTKPDIAGMGLCTAIIGTILCTLLGSSEPPAPRVAAYGTAAVIAAVIVLVYIEKRSNDPVLHIAAYRDPVRRRLLLSLSALFAVNSGFLFFSYIDLVHLRGLSAFQASLLLGSASAPAIITARLASRYSTSRLSIASLGLAIMAGSLFLTHLADPPNPRSLAIYAGTGIGLGLTNSAALAELTIRTANSKSGRSAATAATMSMLGGALGPALAGTLVAAHAARWRQSLKVPVSLSEAAYRAASGGAPLKAGPDSQSLIVAAHQTLGEGINQAFLALGTLSLLAGIYMATARLLPRKQGETR
ncbi:MFS transporter [Streptomyces sp. NPDC127051]|uniref:MFS transporter n=1 Tax=Streptomyces sp. NPDC127051 TaxID=3347119 RepID=UPI00364C6085